MEKREEKKVGIPFSKHRVVIVPVVLETMIDENFVGLNVGRRE